MICLTPIVIRGCLCALWPFLMIWRWNIPQTTGIGMSDWCYQSECACLMGYPADSRKAMNLLHWEMHTILYWRIVVAIEMASKLVIVVCVVISNVWMTFLELSFKKSELLLLLLSSTNVLNVQTLFYENPNRKWIANELLMGTRTWCKAWVPNEDSWQLPYSGISENHNKDTLPNFDVTATFLRNCDSLQNIFSIWIFTPTQSKCSDRVSPHHLPTSL